MKARCALLRPTVLVIVLVLTQFAAPRADAAIFNGTPGADNIYGTNSSDTIFGDGAGDTLFGRGGNDSINGGTGADFIFLGRGRDVIDLGIDGNQVVDDDGKSSRREKPDSITGSAAQDTIFSADGEPDRVNCGEADVDFAVVDLNDRVQNCEIVLAFNGEIALGRRYFSGTSSSETLTGSSGNDVMAGKNGGDVINGGAGNDTLLGGKSADTVIGGADADTIFDDDGRGGDNLQGGAGFDILISVDGGVDSVDCGSGDGIGDSVFVDAEDNVTGCTGADLVTTATPL